MYMNEIMILINLFYKIVGLGLMFICTFLRINRWWSKQRLRSNNLNTKKSLAFFHPYCNSGGGGERVLWKMIEAILTNETLQSRWHIVIYSGDNHCTAEDILENVKAKFGIDFPVHQRALIQFVFIQSRSLLDAKWYPVATMICQSIASMLIGLECLFRFTPDVYCDTTGAAFTYPLASILAGCQIIAYVHYPIISTDMLRKVREQRPSYNNNQLISKSLTISTVKLVYYQIFAWCYGIVGSFASLVFVNSTWTRGHISHLWNLANNHSNRRKLVTIYPPCNTTNVQAISLDAHLRKKIILSIGQFRPEKDHMLQLRSFKLLLSMENHKYSDVTLLLLGSTRNDEDNSLVESLRSEADVLGISKQVLFVINAPYADLIAWLGKASLGIHTMWNEHFGISVVEMMAAGLIVVAHNSGGPLMDIVTDYDSKPTGYLAATVEEYAKALSKALDLVNSDSSEALDMRIRARLSSNRYSDEVFSHSMVEQFLQICS